MTEPEPEPETLEQFVKATGLALEEAEKAPWILSIGPALLMGTGFLFVNLAVKQGLTTMGVIWFGLGCVCLKLWKMADNYSNVKAELKQLHLILSALELASKDRQRAS